MPPTDDAIYAGKASFEAARRNVAATLTQIYFQFIPLATKVAPPQGEASKPAIREIGSVYGAFLTTLDEIESEAQAKKHRS